jgi:hypothetical protein
MLLFVGLSTPLRGQQGGFDVDAYRDSASLAIGAHFVPHELVFVDSLDSYVPNPFTVRMACVNRGNAAAHDVHGTLELPEHMVFDPPTQSATQAFIPAEMPPWHPGDPVPELEWTVRWEPRLRHDVQSELRFVVKGEDADGVALDSVDHRSQIHIPGLQPVYYCNIIDTPDSLAARADGTGVEPNPFTVRYLVRNTSRQTGRIQQVVLYIPMHEGVQLHPSSPNPLSFRPEVTLAPDEEIIFTWEIDVVNRIAPRKFQVQTIAYDDEGNPLPCDKWISVAGIPTLGVTQPATAGLFRLHANHPNPFAERTTFTFDMQKRAHARLSVHNLLGEEVAVPVDAVCTPGLHHIMFTPGVLPSGMYIYRLQVGGHVQARMFTLLP